MAEILITGIEMPRTYNNPLCIAIYPDGVIKEDCGEGFLIHTKSIAQELPPHGRLIDADAFKEYITKAFKDFEGYPNFDLAKKVTEDLCLDIDEAPTVIEASKET